MSLIGNIDNVPLFSTIQEALDWAVDNNMSGYHTHVIQGQTRYMGGVDHQQATVYDNPSINTPQTPTGGSSNSGY